MDSIVNNIPKKNTQQSDEVSNQHPTYNLFVDTLNFLYDVYQGKPEWQTDLKRASLYLPRESEEPNDAYNARLKKSRFERIFRSIITEDLSGLLTNYSLTSPPESFELASNNIDILGNSLNLFLKQLDTLALRDGSVFVLVDFPKEDVDSPIITESDRIQAGFRPYLIAVPRSNLINWHYTITSSGLFLQLAVIRELITELVGDFSIEEVVQYRVLRPGEYTVYREIEDELVVVDSGTTNLPLIPLLGYSLSGTLAFDAEPPLHDIAEANVSLFQLESERRELLHKLCMPILTVNDLQPEFSNDDERPIIIGSNTVLRNTDSKFIEPQGSSLQVSQEEQKLLYESINKKVLAFLGMGASMTATQANLSSSHAKSTLLGYAQAKESLIQSIMRYWTLYTSETLAEDTGASVDLSILNTPINLTVSEIINAVTAGVLSKRLALLILTERGLIPSDYDLSLETDSQAIASINPPTSTEVEQRVN